MATLDPIKDSLKISQLDQASARVAAGGAQAAVKDASGKVINAGDQANIDYATKNYGYKLANAVDNSGKTPFELSTGIEGYDAALAREAANRTTTTNETSWMEDWMKDAFGRGDQQAVDQVQAPTFDVERSRLEQAKSSRVQALDAQYATNLATTQKRNKDLGSSLKAKLMKLGVSPSDSAWANAEAGQSMRDAEAESKLRSEYMSNKAAIESDLDAKISTLAMNEATMKFNSTVKNIENKLATQAQGINLYQIFSSRDQSEKDREQRAYAALQDYEAKMMTLDQQQQEAISKNLIENAQKGLYNISDKATLEMLANLEKQSPYLTGLTNIASAGLSDRLDEKAQAAADLQLTKAQTSAASRSNTGGGGGDKDMSEAQKKSLAGYIGEVSGYASREDALADLNKFSTKIMLETGPNGMALINAEIDRLFGGGSNNNGGTSADTSMTNPKTTQISSPKTSSAIKSIADVLSKGQNQSYIPGAGVEANMAKANKVINDMTIKMSADEKARTIEAAKNFVNTNASSQDSTVNSVYNSLFK